MLSWACTVHKLQDLSFEEGVTNFNLQKQRKFREGQMYTGLSRISGYGKLFGVEKSEPSSIQVNVSVPQEYDRLRQISVFEK